MSQLAREYLLFVNQTVCVEVIYIIYNLCIITNSQITKAHDYSHNNHISNNFINLSLIQKVIIISKQVGISEAIRLILIDIKLVLINLIYKWLISLIFFFGFFFFTYFKKKY